MTSIFARSGLAFVGAVATFLMIPGAAYATDAQPGAAAGVAAATVVQAQSPMTRYCVIVPHTTGSIIDRKICHTRDEWLVTGFDPLAKK